MAPRKQHNQEHAPTIRAAFLSALSRYLFLQAWADEEDRRAEEAGRRSRAAGPGRIEDKAPSGTPASFRAKAAEILSRIESMNGGTIFRIISVAAAADKVAPTADFAKKFGANVAMMVTGTGVSWFDDHAKFPFRYPRVEVYL